MFLKTKLSKIEVEKGIIKKRGLPEGFVITDRNIFERYKNLIKDKKLCFIITPGEESKSIQVYTQILNRLAEIEDISAIIAFGGGVVGDIAGFVASTFKRGVNLIQVPTTLLAMVDSSIGGKNGIDLGMKKNYVGTIYQPKEILIDSSFLDSLSDREIRNGLAEIIKHSYLLDSPKLIRFKVKVNKDDKDINEIILKSAEVKIKIVENDVHDKGLRRSLNFGHTIGHSIELLYGLSHGEAISIGMMKEALLAKRLGFAGNEKINDLKTALINNNLPIDWPENSNADEIIKIMECDKKGKFSFAFDSEHFNEVVDEDSIRFFLKEDINNL